MPDPNDPIPKFDHIAPSHARQPEPETGHRRHTGLRESLDVQKVGTAKTGAFWNCLQPDLTSRTGEGMTDSTIGPWANVECEIQIGRRCGPNPKNLQALHEAARRWGVEAVIIRRERDPVFHTRIDHYPFIDKQAPPTRGRSDEGTTYALKQDGLDALAALLARSIK